MQGLFITFEGIEGCGKSTQAKLLHEYLVSKGLPCILTKEPGGTRLMQRVRELLLDAKTKGLDARAELFLYLADRAQHVKEIIKPALLAGKIVISDRYGDATIAYQGAGRNLPLQEVKHLNKIATGGLIPDITIIIDMPVIDALERIKSRDRMERESVDFHKRVRAQYLELARLEPERIKVLDGTKSIDEIHTEVKKYVDELLSQTS